jgi:hypothetical protein
MKKLILLLVVIALTGCNAHWPKDEAFIKEIKMEIAKYKGKYRIHKYDCSNMSYDMAYSLWVRGYDAKVYAYQYGFNGHAVVKITHNGRDFYSDPARQWAFIIPPTKYPLIFEAKVSQIPQEWKQEFTGHW